MTITPDDAELISEAITSALIDVHVALPGKVQSYNAAEQTAVIELQVKRVLPTDSLTTPFVTETLPVLENVPVSFPRTNKFFMSFPIQAGDTGQVIFHEMSLDQWRSKGVVTSPGDIGRHTLTGGVFFPGLSPNAEALTDPVGSDMVMGEIGGNQIRVKLGGAVEVTSGGGATADDFVAMAAKVKDALDALVAVFTEGTPAINDGGAALQAAWKTAAALIGTDVASGNLKADNPVAPP